MSTLNEIPIAPAPVSTSSPISGQRRIRAVVADDVPEMLEAVSAIVEHGGRVDVVGTAANGLLAVRAAQELRPDLVIVDVNMPTMNGLEAAIHIKRRLPSAKVLVISADDHPDVSLAALDCGADAFMCKSNLIQECSAQLARMFPE